MSRLHPVIVRPALSTDSQAIARIQIDSYRSAYTPILPAAYLAQFSLAEQTQDWLDLIASPGGQILLVAETSDTEVIGYALGRPKAEGLPGCEGELVAMHIAIPWRRHGAGKALLGAMARQLHAAGCAGLGLWVLAKNQPARDVYAHLGGQQAGEQSFAISDEESFVEVSYVWPDIQALCVF